MDRNPRVGASGLFLATFVGLALTHSAARAQEVQPPRWTVSAGVGTMLPAWLYNEWVTASTNDTSFETGYSERIRMAPLFWGAMRYRSQSDFGMFFGVEHASADTDARFIGGRAGQQRIRRNVRIWTFSAGMTVRFARWANGAGVVEYVAAPVLTYHKLDLSNGHRDAFAHEFGAPEDRPLEWGSRSWTGWGFTLGMSGRFPVAQDLGLRVGVNNLVLPAANDAMASLEAADVRRLSGRQAVFNYRAFTTFYPSIQIGVEYVLGRVQPRARATAALPPPSREVGAAEASAETRAAREMMARGDTAAAIEALRARVREAPQDASAWRDLALLLAAAAETNPATLGQAWEMLQRAVVLNPDDAELLAAYGRTRALLQRTRTPAETTARSFTMSDVAVQADGAGGLSLAVSASDLAPSEDGRVRYRMTIDVFDPAGEAVPLRLADAPDSAATTVLDIERVSDSPSVTERIELRLARAQLGAHTVRVRITSLASGQSITRAAGFQIR